MVATDCSLLGALRASAGVPYQHVPVPRLHHRMRQIDQHTYAYCLSVLRWCRWIFPDHGGFGKHCRYLQTGTTWKSHVHMEFSHIIWTQVWLPLGLKPYRSCTPFTTNIRQSRSCGRVIPFRSSWVAVGFLSSGHLCRSPFLPESVSGLTMTRLEFYSY